MSVVLGHENKGTNLFICMFLNDCSTVLLDLSLNSNSGSVKVLVTNILRKENTTSFYCDLFLNNPY